MRDGIGLNGPGQSALKNPGGHPGATAPTCQLCLPTASPALLMYAKSPFNPQWQQVKRHCDH